MASNTHREASHITVRALVESFIHEGFLTGADAYLSQLIFEVADEPVSAAQALCRAGQFDDAVTLRAIQACCKNPAGSANGVIVGPDNIWKSGVPAKAINREIWLRNRAGICCVTVKMPDGKAKATKRVIGEIIRT